MLSGNEQCSMWLKCNFPILTVGNRWWKLPKANHSHLYWPSLNCTALFLDFRTSSMNILNIFSPLFDFFFACKKKSLLLLLSMVGIVTACWRQSNDSIGWISTNWRRLQPHQPMHSCSQKFVFFFLGEFPLSRICAVSLKQTKLCAAHVRACALLFVHVAAHAGQVCRCACVSAAITHCHCWATSN